MNDYTTGRQYRQEKTARAKGALFSSLTIYMLWTLYIHSMNIRIDCIQLVQ